MEYSPLQKNIGPVYFYVSFLALLWMPRLRNLAVECQLLLESVRKAGGISSLRPVRAHMVTVRIATYRTDACQVALSISRSFFGARRTGLAGD